MVAVPDYPRVPPSYRFHVQAALLQQVEERIQLSLPSGSVVANGILAAAVVVLAAHAGDEQYCIKVGDHIISGKLPESGLLEELLQSVGDRSICGQEQPRLEVNFSEGDEGKQGKEQSTVLQLRARRRKNELDVTLSYDSSVLPPLEATWFLQHFVTAISSIISASSPREIRQVNLSSTSELDTIRAFTCSPPPPAAYPTSCTNLVSFLENSVGSYRDLPALQFDEQVLSFHELYKLGIFFARKLIATGARPGTIIALCVDKRLEMVPCMVGILLAGCGYVNLEPSFPSERKRVIMMGLEQQTELRSGIAVVQSDGGEWETWRTMRKEGSQEPLLGHVLDPSEVFKNALASPGNLDDSTASLPIPNPEHPAYLIYTSGSTGAPKGIVVDNRNVAAFLRNYRDVFGRTVGDRVLQFPSYSFDVSVMNIWDTLAHGATICQTSHSAMLSDLGGAILRLGCTIVDLTPTISALLFEYPEAQPSGGESVRDAWLRAGFKVKAVNTGGEKVERWIKDAWMERGVRVVVDYGPSETTVGVVANQRTHLNTSTFSIGRPTGNNVVHILSVASLEPVPLGCVGEICVAGEQVTRGYVKRELNEGVFIQHERYGRLYRTGDLGRYLADADYVGSIDCLGRKDGQVKVNGLRIEVGEIEKHLSSRLHPNLLRGVVDKLVMDQVSPGLVAFLILSPDSNSAGKDASLDSSPVEILSDSSSTSSQALISDLKAALARDLPEYMIPRYWLVINRIPTQGMGKADRKALRSLAEQHTFHRPSRSSTRQVVQNDEQRFRATRSAWGAILRQPVESLDDSDDFMRLGGDSIGFVRAIGLLRSQGFGASFNRLVDATVLSSFAGHLELPAPGAHETPAYKRLSLLDLDTVSQALSELSADHSIDPTHVDDIYPTAPSQDTLLAGSLDSTHYYAQAIYPIDEATSTKTLADALRSMVRRHSALRTCFVLLECYDKPLQVVLSPESPQVSQSCLVSEISSDFTQDWLKEDRASHSFQWGRLALSFAVALNELTGKKELIWGMHHATSDGWTLELLTSELRRLCSHQPLGVEPPPFASFVGWWNTSPSSGPDPQTFWGRYLEMSSTPSWPSVAPPHHTSSTTAVEHKYWIGDLPKLAKRHGITPAIASRVAIAVALAKQGAAEETILGVVRSGRDVDLDQADCIIGPCVSVLPSRIRIGRDTSLLDVAKSELANDRLARVHQRVALSDLVKMTGTSDRSTLFNTLVTFQSLADDGGDEKTPWPIRQPPAAITMPTSYSLSFEVTPERKRPNALEISTFYDPELCQRSEVLEVMENVEIVLDWLATAPCTLVKDLSLTGGEGSSSVKPFSNGNGRAAEKGEDFSSKLAIMTSAWARVLRINGEDLDADSTFTSQGGDSIAMMRLSAALSKAGITIPVGMLVKLPTLRDQTSWLCSN